MEFQEKVLSSLTGKVPSAVLACVRAHVKIIPNKDPGCSGVAGKYNGKLYIILNPDHFDLEFVACHEIAHLALGHMEGKRRWRGISASVAKKAEAEADQLALFWLRRIGAGPS